MFSSFSFVPPRLKAYLNMRVFSRIEHPENLYIGKNVGWNYGCWINAHGGVIIGDNTVLGPYCVIHSANHKFGKVDVPICRQGHVLKPVFIGEDCWLGAHVTVVPGTIIEKGCVIGAGSVVTKHIPPYSVAVGNPARVIKKRK